MAGVASSSRSGSRRGRTAPNSSASSSRAAEESSGRRRRRDDALAPPARARGHRHVRARRSGRWRSFEHLDDARGDVGLAQRRGRAGRATRGRAGSRTPARDRKRQGCMSSEPITGVFPDELEDDASRQGDTHPPGEPDGPPYGSVPLEQIGDMHAPPEALGAAARPPDDSPRPTTLAWEPLSAIEMRSIVFLDKPLWQADAFHLVTGRKGVGKGTVLANLAARVTRGELGPKRRVVWIGSEDSASIDIKPRVIAAGGDPKLI